MQELLEEEAKRLGEETGFVRRVSKLSASKFVETLVLGHLERPDASLNDLVQVSADLGVAISVPGLQARINGQGVKLLEGLLKASLGRMDSRVQLPAAVLEAFSAVYVLDSSIVTLPAAMQEQFAGFASTGSEAAIKFQLCYEYKYGNLRALEWGAGRCNDQSCTLPERLAQPDSLHLADLGYFDQDTFASLARQGAYFVSRYKYATNLYAQLKDNQALDLLAVLRQHAGNDYEQRVYLGGRQRVAVRLLCQRLPEVVVQQRRRKALAAARKKGHTCPQAYLELLAWNIFITNTSPDQLSFDQVLMIYRLRWQIELLFKLWKSQAHLARLGTARPERILCTLFARLLGLVLFQALVAPFRVLRTGELSLPKAFQVLQHHALRLLDSIAAGWRTTPAVLDALLTAFTRFALKDKRVSHPSAYSRLLALKS